ncbi:Ves G 1 allergen precursor, putative [Pediculus humanus corporis]|uniref:Ves G 1 allergen, putative n=1 Tax=Pediculus humanus subsp. corporis TaxID=121224 RepID=E0W3V9_PEDHC|nr:Ves G 1 allergen precursor, putative [Pediculus humanus corporis]EEB20315.1 Ves G 1 allergen precursor, putative [Pediculus humanus corporis]
MYTIIKLKDGQFLGLEFFEAEESPQDNSINGTTKKKPQTVQDLYNTTSCVEPPIKCPHRRIQFFLYTRQTQEEGELLDVTDINSLYNSKFNALHPTKIIIHGFGGGRNLIPSPNIRKAYFSYGEYNVIIVDYGTLAKEPCLSQIEWSPRFCAECVAQLVDYLAVHPRGVQPHELHLIGYSVGAHMAGLVANHISFGKLGRITGLDPTIIFYMGNNRSRDLDPTDAHFVDVLHTGAGVLGQWGPNGHADFYFNGGSSQPGCQSSTILKTLACDHTRVTPFFIESIISPIGFWASPCPNRFMYSLGLCPTRDEDYVIMGEHAPWTARGIYYLTTNARKPYAQGFPGKKRPTEGDSRTAKNKRAKPKRLRRN